MTNFARLRDLIKQEERLGWAVKRQNAKCTRSTQVFDSVPRGGGDGQRMESDAVRLVLLKEQHGLVKAELDKERAGLKIYMRRLDNGTQRAAMEMRYMKGVRVTEIGDAMGYTERQVFRILKRAETQINQWQRVKEERG
jgi:DNA-directed RNA polymerase specialized sigma subunit